MPYRVGAPRGKEGPRMDAGGDESGGLARGAGGLSIVLIYLAVNIAAIRAFRTEFRDQFRLWRHLLVPATAAVLFLFPLWGILHPRAPTLADLLPFAALRWQPAAGSVMPARRWPSGQRRETVSILSAGIRR